MAVVPLALVLPLDSIEAVAVLRQPVVVRQVVDVVERLDSIEADVVPVGPVLPVGERTASRRWPGQASRRCAAIEAVAVVPLGLVLPIRWW